MPLVVNAAARARWLQLMTKALDEVQLPEDVDALLRGLRFAGVSGHAGQIGLGSLRGRLPIDRRPSTVMKKTLDDPRSARRASLRGYIRLAPRQSAPVGTHDRAPGGSSPERPVPVDDESDCASLGCDAFLENGHQMDCPAGADDVAAWREDAPRGRPGNRRDQTGGVLARSARARKRSSRSSRRDGGDDFQPHPMFGRLTTGEWHRWGWLHTDHPLSASVACPAWRVAFSPRTWRAAHRARAARCGPGGS